MEKWNGVTMAQLVIEPIREMIEDGATQDEILEEVVDYRERGFIPESAMNWVLHQIS